MSNLIRSEWYQLTQRRTVIKSIAVLALFCLLATIAVRLMEPSFFEWLDSLDGTINQTFEPLKFTHVQFVTGAVETMLDLHIALALGTINEVFNHSYRDRLFVLPISHGIPRHQLYLAKWCVALQYTALQFACGLAFLSLSCRLILPLNWHTIWLNIPFHLMIAKLPFIIMYLTLFLTIFFMFQRGLVTSILCVFGFMFAIDSIRTFLPILEHITPFLFYELSYESTGMLLNWHRDSLLALLYTLFAAGFGIYHFNHKHIH